MKRRKTVGSRGPGVLGVLVGAAVGAALVAAAWAIVVVFKDYGGEFRERKGILRGTSIRDAGGDSLFRKSWLTLDGTGGVTVECGMLVPRSVGRRYPAIILLGGKATGKHAVDYALDLKDVLLVAVDYPYEPRENYTMGTFLADVPGMRRALLDMVPSVMLVNDYLRSRDDVDTGRIVLLGYSFGAPLIPAIVAHDARAAAVVMVYGGGDLRSLVRHNVRRYEGPLMSELAGQLAGALLRPLEPMRWSDRITPVPLLMINGTHDEQIPRAQAELFYAAACEPKKIVWIDSRHVHPRDVKLTRKIISVMKEELGRMGVLTTAER